MRKLKDRNIAVWVFLLALIYTINVNAQDVQFTVNAPSKVEQGGQFRITYSVNQDGEFIGPDFGDFKLLGGPSQSTSTSMQIINGRTSSSTKKSYTYYLSAPKIGSFKLPIATFKYKSKIYKSAPLAIEVIKSVQTSAGSGNQSISNPEFNPDGVVFVRSIVNKKNAYIGEPILLTQKLYSKENVSNITDFKEPSYTGFWKEDIDIGDLKLSKEVVNGIAYNVVVLQKSILFPQKNGKLELGSFKLDVSVQIIKKRKARDRFEQMMYGNIVQYYDNKNLSLNSPVVKLNVKSLPLPKPSNFSGVVGSFNMEASVDKTELKANDAFNLKVKISGKGNVDLLESPKFNFPPDFEVYDPKISKKSKNSTSGVSGSKTYDYLIIPRNPGDFKIPKISFSYFNPQTEHYESCTSPEFKIHVLPGDGESYAVASGSSVNRDEVKYVGKDIRHIMLNMGAVKEIGEHSFNSLMHILTLILLPVFSIFIIIFLKKRELKRANISHMRLKKATKMAKKRLKNAYKFLQVNDNSKFYEETSKAIWGYISDKFNLSMSELSIDVINDKLAQKGAGDEDVKEVKDILETCEYARYSPSQEQSDLNNLYNRSISIISKIEKTLK
jgi:hypothetical protein